MVGYDEKNGELVCSFSGRLDSAATAELCEEVLERVRAAETVIFDLRDVDYVSSAFLRLCFRAAKEKDQSFSIVNENPSILKVLKIAGFDKLMSIS